MEIMSSIRDRVKNMPENPGVYLFRKGLDILYIGKATSLRSRVRSYFSNDLLSTRGPLLVSMVREADSIIFKETDSVLEALILEANLIKKHKPIYNSKEKDDKSWNYVVLTREHFPRVLLMRGRELFNPDFLKTKRIAVKTVFGPFPYGLELREALKIIRRIFPYRDDKCIPAEVQLAAKRGRSEKIQLTAFHPRPCFNRQIGLCPGVCTGEISVLEYNNEIRKIALFFRGKKSELIRLLKKEMTKAADEHHFEKAGEIKRRIFSLQHIRDVALMKREVRLAESESAVFRIEAYDIAHTSGKMTAGVMTVVENGEAKKPDYRMFRIRGEFNGSDSDALKEVLRRRFRHSEWPLPKIIVLDGGIVQFNAAREVLASEPALSSIQIVSVVKNERHEPDHFLGNAEIVNQKKSDFLLANSEAHRFALKYHRKLRNGFI